MTQRDPAAIKAAFQEIVDKLLVDVDCGRTTIRINMPELGCDIRTPVVEAKIDSAPTLLDKVRTNQENSGTLNFLKRERRFLLQDDCANPSPDAYFPPELIAQYSVKSQMMGGLFPDGEFIGFVSAHETRGPRHWTAEEAAILEKAIERTLEVALGTT